MDIPDPDPASPIHHIQAQSNWDGPAFIFLHDVDAKGARKFITVDAERLADGHVADKLHLAPAFVLMRAVAVASAARLHGEFRTWMEAAPNQLGFELPPKVPVADLRHRLIMMAGLVIVDGNVIKDRVGMSPRPATSADYKAADLVIRGTVLGNFRKPYGVSI
jgi:hypothetical protein